MNGCGFLCVCIILLAARSLNLTNNVVRTVVRYFLKIPQHSQYVVSNFGKIGLVSSLAFFFYPSLHHYSLFMWAPPSKSINFADLLVHRIHIKIHPLMSYRHFAHKYWNRTCSSKYSYLCRKRYIFTKANENKKNVTFDT